MKIQTYNAPLFQASYTPVSVPNNSGAWSGVLGLGAKLVQIGSNLDDERAKEEGGREGAQRQYEAGTAELTRSPEGLFGKTIRGIAADKAADIAYTVLKKNDVEKGMYEIEQKFGHDPEAFAKATTDFRQKYLASVPLDRIAGLQTDFDEKALSKQRVVDTAARKLKQDQDVASINGRLDTLITRMGNSITQDWFANQNSILSDAAEIEALLGESIKPTSDAGPLIPPSKAQEYRERITEQLGKNYAFYLFDRGSKEERKSILGQLRGGEFTMPELGRDGNNLVERGRQIPIESARKIAAEIETAYAKKAGEGKMQMAMIKLALGEQTSATEANQQAHPELGKTLQSAMALLPEHPELLDDIRKAQVAQSVAVESRPYLYKSADAIASDINRVQAGILNGTSKDVFRDTQLLKSLREIQGQKEAAAKAGTETEYLHMKGLVPETPYYDLSNPNSLEAARAARMRAESLTGREQPILDDRFIGTAKEIIETGTARDRQGLLEFVTKIPRDGNERQRMFNQLGKKNPELGQLAYYFGAVDSVGQPDQIKRGIARDALAGLDYYAANSMDTAKEQEARHRVNAELSKVVSDPTQVSGLSRMAFGLMVENARVSGQLGKSDAREFSSKDARQAVGRLIGASEHDMKSGRLPTINDTTVVPFERGMSNTDMNLIWRSLTDDSLKAMNSGQLPRDATGLEVDAKKIIDRGRLRYVSPGQYEIIYTDPGVNTDTYPVRDPSTALLSGRVNLGRAVPFVFRFDTATKDMLWAATKKPRVPEAVNPEFAR
ncbi:hypothetical protein [Ferrovibrio sp.]|uniref:hypothetical protein n=1 Tax=Ferrovibrio sp. TaxID=1917215 RepID=UPI0035B1156F